MVEAAQGLSQAEEANGNDRSFNRLDNRIPAYPPQKGDGLTDDDQDREEYPQDEQRD